MRGRRAACADPGPAVSLLAGAAAASGGPDTVTLITGIVLALAAIVAR